MDLYKLQVDQILDDIVSSLPENTISKVMSYALVGGKRLRPALTIAFLRESKNVSDDQEKAISYAAACVEMLHTASLIIDDLPCMDNDDIRRGRPSVHKAFGETTAQLVSTSMTCLSLQLLLRAFRSLERDYGFDQSNALGMKAMEILTEKLGLVGASEGQMLDQAFMRSAVIDNDDCQTSWRRIMSEYVNDENGKPRPEMIEKVIHKKTSTFFELALIFGNMISTGTDKYVDDMSEMGKWLGLCYQILDDFENVRQDWETQGENSSINYVLQLGLKQSWERYNEAETKCREIAQFWIPTLVDEMFKIFRKRLEITFYKAEEYLKSFTK